MVVKEAVKNPFTDFKFAEEFESESRHVLGDEATDKIFKYIEDVKENCNRTNFSIKVPLPAEKEGRMKVHNLIRTHLPFMESITRNINNLKKVQKEVKAQSKLSGEQPPELEEYILIKVHVVNFKRYKCDTLFGGEQKTKNFLTFTLMKRNIDTINVGILVSKYLSISNKHFQMAGIKDKRGITS